MERISSCGQIDDYFTKSELDWNLVMLIKDRKFFSDKQNWLLLFQIIVFLILIMGLRESIPVRRWLYISIGIAILFVVYALRKSLKKIIENIILKGVVWAEAAYFVVFTLIAYCILAASDMVNTRAIGELFYPFRTFSNVLIYLAIILLFRTIFNKSGIVILSVSTFLFVFNLASYYVFCFRGMPIVPWDIYAIKTAEDVAGNYVLFTDEYMIYAWILTCIVQHVAFCTDVKTMGNASKRVIPLVELIVIIFGFVIGFYPLLWTDMADIQLAYEKEGFLAGFLAHVEAVQYKAPRDYAKDTVAGWLNESDVLISADETTIHPKNIIVIMNESFADLSCLGTELEEDYMPFLHSLDENTIHGSLVVPTFGGGTCDTEFEFLTGLSCKYNLHYPYISTLNQEIPSLIRTLKNEGFYCEAYHPGDMRNWNRGEAYRLIGFDEMTFLPEERDDIPFINGYATDEYDYQVLIDHFENRDTTKPFFFFNVTIQNHGGYFEDEEGLELTDEARLYSDYSEAEVYFSLVQESDRSLEHLINYFNDLDEPTLICFFGDHLPKLEEDFLSGLQNGNEDPFCRYETPMFIWANYDIPEQNIGRISANYLSTYLLKCAGYSFSELDTYLWNLYQDYPVVSKWGVINNQGEILEDGLTQTGQLDKYDDIVYYQLRDAMSQEE